MRWNLVIPIALCLAGCASKGKVSENMKLNQWLLAADAQVPPIPYDIQPPDEITVSAPGVSELDKQTRTVGTDGTVTFRGLGAVMVAGKTADQVGMDLKRLAGAKLYRKEKLEITVRVSGYKSRFIYVFGPGVDTPGPRPYTGRDSMMKVLADAQFNNDAWPEKVIVARPNDDPNVKQKITIDVYAMYARGDVSKNILLEPGDLLYVPRTPLSEFAVAFDKIISPLKPASALASMARMIP